MNQRAANLNSRIETVSSFGDLVNAMRGVAASRAQRSQLMIEGVDSYAGTVARAIVQALALTPPVQDKTDNANSAPICLVFCAEQGFCGGYSDRVLTVLGKKPTSRIFLLGSHGLRLASSRGIEPEWSAPTIVHPDGAVSLSDRLHKALTQALLHQPAGIVEMIYGEALKGTQFEVRRVPLLPLALPVEDQANTIDPLVHLSPEKLLADLAVEYITAQLVRALLHSHTAENLARLRAMAAAHDNVERMAQTLKADERRYRQESITDEIVEISNGLRHPSAA